MKLSLSFLIVWITVTASMPSEWFDVGLSSPSDGNLQRREAQWIGPFHHQDSRLSGRSPYGTSTYVPTNGVRLFRRGGCGSKPCVKDASPPRQRSKSPSSSNKSLAPQMDPPDTTRQLSREGSGSQASRRLSREGRIRSVQNPPPVSQSLSMSREGSGPQSSRKLSREGRIKSVQSRRSGSGSIDGQERTVERVSLRTASSAGRDSESSGLSAFGSAGSDDLVGNLQRGSQSAQGRGGRQSISSASQRPRLTEIERRQQYAQALATHGTQAPDGTVMISLNHIPHLPTK